MISRTSLDFLWDLESIQWMGAPDIFLPLKGSRSDGHDFIPSAIEKGASLIFVSRKDSRWKDWVDKHPGVSWALVDDPLRVLQRWASLCRSSFSTAYRIGITGSNGKTTTKEILKALLSEKGRVYTNPGNLNSDIGLPLSLLGVEKEPDYLILEMGMNRKGEMTELAEIFFPNMGVVTNIGVAHIGILGSQEAIALEKKAIFSKMKADGVAVLPQDDRYFEFLKKDFTGKVLTFSRSQVQGLEGLEGFEGLKFFWEGNEYRLPMSGEHNLSNALAAMTVARALGLSPDQIRRGLAKVKPAFGRGQMLRGEVSVYQDCYNANPESMDQLIEQLSKSHWPGKKVLVLGSMGELGDWSQEAHKALGRKAAALNGVRIFFFGAEAQVAQRALEEEGFSRSSRWTENYEELSTLVLEVLGKGDLLVLKGSRVNRLERLTDDVFSRWKKEGEF